MSHTKKSLLTSVTALVVCFTMLVSSTFAWFTSTVTSSNNIIASGNLKVELLHENAFTKSQAMTSVEVTETADKTKPKNKLFVDANGNDMLWEPGAVAWENFTIRNAGDLALVYQFALSTDKENYVVNADGTTTNYGLSQVLKVGVVDGGLQDVSSREAVINAVNGNWSSIKSFVKTDTNAVLPNDDATTEANETERVVGVVVYWQPSDSDNLYNLNNGKTVSNAADGATALAIDLGIKVIATQASYEEDSFGKDYDAAAADSVFPAQLINEEVTVPVSVADDGTLAAPVTLSGKQVTATVPAGTKLAPGTTALTMTITELNDTNDNIAIEENEESRSLDVHIDGIAPDNTVAAIFDMGQVMPTGLNIGNYTLYHVESGASNTMIPVSNATAVDAHNEFYYDPADGNLTIALANFSEVALVANTENAWEGKFDYTWYDASKTELTIANADQLAAFGAIVGGMDGQTQDSFAGKTVKLISDINLGYEEGSETYHIFYPIGYNSSDGKYEKTGVAITSSLKNFEGTFDGNGHTISNFYQNTWEMKGDHDWYSPEEQYYRDGMGLFGRVYGGTVKNLTVKNFSSDGEIATTGVIAAYADFGATFENIAIFNCNPRVYNIGNGGIVGCVGWYTKGETDKKVTLKNITVDNSNKISALWGSYDVACGGLVGQYYPTSGQSSANYPVNAGIHFDNCHVSAQMDVYNDVCANYQYYAYRYTGMMIGSVRENVEQNGHSYPKMDGISAKDCTVHFGTWNDYYYCEIIDNTTASYTHDYQMSRLTEVKAIDDTTVTYLDGTTGTVPASGRANYVIVDYTKGHGTENATCYHFKDGVVWTHDMGGIQTGIDENGDGQDDLKEDKQHIYLEFNNLVTGYGWGVTSKGVGDLAGVTILDREVANSVEKFAKADTAKDSYTTGTTVTIGELFKAKTIDDSKLTIKKENVQVTVSPVGEGSTAGATYEANTTDWTQGTLTFSGIGAATITITDYYFCTPTTITVEIKAADKFVKKFDKDFLYRVGNQNTVPLSSLFAAKEGTTIDNVSVTVESIKGASGAYTSNTTWTNGTIQFSDTGLVKVTISGDDATPVELILEVVDAVNATTATNATENNVVLLNDISSGFTVSGRYAVYGNGFTLNYAGNGQYLNNGLKQGIVTVSENGTLDNLRIKASIYPSAYMFYGQTTLGEYVQGGPKTVDGDKTRYHYQLSAVAASGNATISNCYIYGGRNNVFVNTGDVTVKDTVLECAPVANIQIQSNASHTITLENVTTIQYQVNPTIGDTNKVMLGAGVIVGPETNDNPTIVLNGDFKQYNWVNEDDKKAVESNKTAEMIISSALDATAYNHTVNGETASNLGIIYMNAYDSVIKNNTELPYKVGTVTMSGVNGKVCSVQGATANQIYSDYENADRDTINGWYQPQFKYPADLGGQYVAQGDGDEHCYREGDTIYVMFPSGDTKELNLAKLVNINKYKGQDLGLTVTCKDEKGNNIAITDGKVVLSEAGTYTIIYTVTDALFYDKTGNINESKPEETYSWNVKLDVSLKDTASPNAYFEFDSTKQQMGYYKGSDVKQYLPFLAGLKIYDYNGKTKYLRFDGSDGFSKIASITITGYESNKALVEVKLTDGGVINTRFLARANSSGASTYTGKIKTSGNTVYFVNDGRTGNKAETTTAAYWYVDYYKFTGNNGVAIQSEQQTFNSIGSSASTPSGNFSTTIKYNVTYDANGGNCGQTTGYATSVSTAVTLPTPARSGYIFAGWYTDASGGTRVGGAGESYTPSANITLYAQWGKPCTVTYDANGGSCGTASEKYTGTALTLPTPTRDGYWFIGWYDAADGGNKTGDAGATYNPSGEITLYAHWQEKVEYTVTYNANGGNCGTASATYQGTALTLPTPTRTGYTFNGWYTAASGGTKIGDAGANYIPSANITMYAQWTINSYTITVTTNNATVKVNGTTVNNNGTISIQYGAQVTVEVTYSKSDSRSTTIKGTDGTTYTSPFTMPAQNVTINATSNECITPDTLITLADGTQKRVDALTGDELLLAWNLATGKYEAAPMVFVDSEAESAYNVIHLNFSDDSEVKVIYEHGFFDIDLGEYVYITEANYADYIGHRFVTQGNIDKDTWNVVTLTDVFVETEVTTAWSPVTAEHLCYYTNGVLSMPGGIAGLFNIFAVDTDLMMYDAELMAQDIATYGLFSYEDFGGMITEDAYAAFNGDWLKVAIGKGLLTWDDIAYMAERYIPLM